MKTPFISLLTLLSLAALSPAANTILIGTDPLEEAGSPDGWDGIAVMTTPIEGPPGETLGIVSTFNFYADPTRVDPPGLLTPLIIKQSGGSYTVASVGRQIEVTEGGLHSVPFEAAEGSDTVDLSGDDSFHIAIAQERVDGTNNAAGGVVPFTDGAGKGMFYFDTQPPHEPTVGDAVEAGHESAEGGRLYQFNFELEFSDDDPNALLPRRIDLGQIPASIAHPFSIDIRNSGESNPLLVESVTVTGGAQAANFSITDFTPSVEPRGAGTIDVQIDALGQTGLFQASIEVQTNDATPEDQTLTVEITASVLNLLGPAAHLPLDEPAGSTELIDVTGFNRHGVINAFDGVVTLGGPGLHPETGTAMTVSGGGGGGIPGSSFEGTLNEFGIALWARPAALGSLADQSFGTLIGMGVETPVFGLLSADGQLHWFGEVNGAADVVFGTENTPMEVGAVHHIVMMRSDARASIWIDGEEAAFLDNPPPVTDTQDGTLYFGGFNGALGFDGVIDDLQVYDRPLTLEEVTYLHENPGATLPVDAVLHSDNDGLSDEREIELGTDPLNPDTDGDGLSDGEEVDVYNTDPLKPDTDGDLHTDGREITQGTDPNDANDPGVPPAIRAGDPNEPLVARDAVDAWNAVMVIDEERPFNLGAPTGVIDRFEFWVGASVGRVTPFVAERTADNEFIVRAIGTTRVAGDDYPNADEAVSFPFDDDNASVEIQDGWVAGFTVADPDGGNVEGAVIPFDAGGGDMWLAGGPAPEESASIALGEAPNTEGTDTVFTTSLDRLYAFAITATPQAGDPSPGRPFVLENVGLNAAGALRVDIPAGVTADIEYSTDLIEWETIATGVMGTVEETDPVRLAAPEGYYRGK